MADVSETFKRLERDPQAGSQYMLGLLETFFEPLVLMLDAVLDKRLVRTLLQCLVAIIRFRNNAQALWLSELGSYLQGYEGSSSSAAAGTKRVGKLLRSVKWSVKLIDHYLLDKADEAVQRLKGQGERILCIWDGSVLEKAESEKLEGLCPVLSSKAKRKSRSKRGLLFNWPIARPIRVMGMQWTAALISGMHGIPQVAVTRWWTTKGDWASKLRETEEELLRVTVRQWGPLLVHVFDRGYASAYWLQVLGRYRCRFVIRWIHTHVVWTLDGHEKKLWQVGQGKKYLAHKDIRDGSTGQVVTCHLWWTPVRHPGCRQTLFLVKARVKQGVMYLLTNDPVHSEAAAWEVFFTYRRRWRIETSFRYAKCELALESPRLWSFDARLKLLGLVVLVYAFLLSLLDPGHREVVDALLRFKCHRTGKRCKETVAPLYRLRWALSRLWEDHRPRLTCFLPPSSDPLAVGSLICFVERVHKNWG
jgi:hypothetical protein